MQRTYRPLCILDVLGKVYERLLLSRLEYEMRVPLSPSQYGFRKGCSTITAPKKVLEMANEAKNNGLKKLCCSLVPYSSGSEEERSPFLSSEYST